MIVLRIAQSCGVPPDPTLTQDNNYIFKEENSDLSIQSNRFSGEKNIAHLDLKPENILLDKDNHTKICDLGMAKFVGKEIHTIFEEMEVGWAHPGIRHWKLFY